jgi:glyoxylase-like metal-dependent hydrolase (beta-lactamase superfamily II)
MYELMSVGPQTYYMDCPVKVGFFFTQEGEVFLIDSGIDKDTAKKAEKHIIEKGGTLKAIINTHSHADHCGGDKYLQDKYNCPVYASSLEASIIRNPILEPSFLYGGFPYKALQNKFLMAKPAEAQDIESAHLPQGFEIVDLPGHYFQQIGIKTPDHVWFIADSVFGEKIIEKYPYSFMYDVKSQMETLDKLLELKGCFFIPSHGDPAKSMESLVRVNRQALENNLLSLKSICEKGRTWEEILKEVFDSNSLILDHGQYVLMGSTIRSYLSYLYDEKEITVDFQENRMVWSLL